MSDSETDDDESDQCWVQSSDDTDGMSGGEQTSDDQYEKLGAVFGPAGSSAGAQPDGDAADSAFAKALKDLPNFSNVRRIQGQTSMCTLPTFLMPLSEESPV